MADVQKTIHYSKNEALIRNLIPYIDINMKLVEPFYGEGDLMSFFPENEWEYYDLLSQEKGHQRDSLEDPPSYKGKWVITNPPYLAKNKAKDKRLFLLYPDVDDLYKIAIKTILEAEGGILIIPVNFLADSKSEKIREDFFSRFEIKKLNIYKNQMFENTTYNVCSFFFQKRKDEEKQKMDINTIIFPEEEQCILSIEEQYGWRIGGETFYILENADNIFNRLTEDNPNPTGFITNINIVCIDKTNEPLHFFYGEPFYGKNTDRNICSLVSKVFLSEEEQNKIIEKANNFISKYRKNTYNLCFTNYRDRNRKRIGFKEAYSFASLAYKKIQEEKG